MKFTRHWAMPNGDTFSIPPIRDFVHRYLTGAKVSVDPFARDNLWATYTNDLNPDTKARFHMDAEDFLVGLGDAGVRADLVIIDPPYSPRQISECYKNVGRPVTMKDTQNAALYRRVRTAADPLVLPGGVVLSFGWNSSGMGVERGYEIMELLLCCHGSGHNDTICLAERKKHS